MNVMMRLYQKNFQKKLNKNVVYLNKDYYCTDDDFDRYKIIYDLEYSYEDIEKMSKIYLRDKKLKRVLNEK